MIKTIFQTQREILECLSDFKAIVKDVDTRVKDVGRIDRYAYQTEEAVSAQEDCACECSICNARVGRADCITCGLSA
jgi:hypothetical protein